MRVRHGPAAAVVGVVVDGGQRRERCAVCRRRRRHVSGKVPADDRPNQGIHLWPALSRQEMRPLELDVRAAQPRRERGPALRRREQVRPPVQHQHRERRAAHERDVAARDAVRPHRAQLAQKALARLARGAAAPRPFDVLLVEQLAARGPAGGVVRVERRGSKVELEVDGGARGGRPREEELQGVCEGARGRGDDLEPSRRRGDDGETDVGEREERKGDR